MAILGDGEAAIRAAELELEKVIVFGRSIGSLYAIEFVGRQLNIAGLIDLQAHDPESTVHYRKIRVKVLPERARH